MKTSLTPAQIKLSVVALVLILVAGVVGWFGLGKMDETRAEAQALGERMGNPSLAALLSDPSGVRKASRESSEIQALEKEMKVKEGAMLDSWAKATQEATGDGQDWSKDSGKWKDRLIEIQNQLQKQSLVNRVRLGPDFYLGLEAFRQKSPSAAEVPGLAVHLSVAARLVELFIQARKAKEQYPTICEFMSLTGPGTSTDKGGEATPPPVPSKPGTGSAGPERKKFRVQIRCSPEVLLQYVHLLSEDPWLLIITDLSLKNEKQEFPLRSEIARQFTAKPTPGEGGGLQPPKKKLLEILAGEESLITDLELDFVTWRNLDENKPAAKSPTP